MKKDIAVFDLDGTIALTAHRQHHLEGGKRDWDAFHAACVDDEPNWPVVATMDALADHGYEIWVVSGRDEKVSLFTLKWFEAHDIDFDELVMRPRGDHTEDHLLKKRWIEDGTVPFDRIAMVFDDRQRVVDMWRGIGLTCFQVAEGDF